MSESCGNHDHRTGIGVAGFCLAVALLVICRAGEPDIGDAIVSRLMGPPAVCSECGAGFYLGFRYASNDPYPHDGLCSTCVWKNRKMESRKDAPPVDANTITEEPNEVK